MIDRWHLCKNLREAVERFLNHTPMPEVTGEQTGPVMARRQKRTSGELARAQGSRERRLALYHEVVALSKQGGSIQEIARQLQISRQTVRKCIQAPAFPEFQYVPRTKSALDTYHGYLQGRWQEGCRTPTQLWEELQARGFAGSWMMVYRWARMQNDVQGKETNPSPSKPLERAKKMAPRHLAWLFLEDSEQLEKVDFLKQLTGALVERCLQAEMEAHLGYSKHEKRDATTGNVRNSSSRKTLKGAQGELDIAVPRDRQATFEPLLIPKHETQLEGFDEKILALYARGMTTRDIQAQILDLYGVEISPTFASNVTEAVLDEVRQWQNRPLEALYPIVYVDCLVIKQSAGEPTHHLYTVGTSSCMALPHHRV